jgi:hypothetical protein
MKAELGWEAVLLLAMLRSVKGIETYSIYIGAYGIEKILSL